MITIIDYGMGNIGSIANMLKRIGYSSEISSDASRIDAAEKIILPGVGHFDKAIINIEKLGLKEVLRKKALKDKTPMLGICLGMQLMCINSEEGVNPGLGLINAEVKRFQFNQNTLKIPHMGWNLVNIKKESKLLLNSTPHTRFYFVHSYHAVCNQPVDILTTTNYSYNFVSAFEHENIVGVQFHPEKSHRFGMELLRNFITLY